MSTQGIRELISTAMGSMKQMIEANNVVGEPVTAPDGSIIIPVTKISCGFGAGGFESPNKDNPSSLDYPFGGGSGGGMKVEPAAFLVIANGNVRLIPASKVASGTDKLLDLVPQMVDKLNSIIKEYVKKPKAEEKNEEE